MAVRAVFADRDGTLIEEHNYLRDPGLVRLFPGTAEAIRLLGAKGYPVFVVSNQSGVARGIIRPEELRAVHLRFEELLREHGVALAGHFYCLHAPEDGCGCRKPLAGGVPRELRGEAVDFAGSFVIGDKDVDLGLADSLGARGLLVRTGYGAGTAEKLRRENRLSRYGEHAEILAAARVIVSA